MIDATVPSRPERGVHGVTALRAPVALVAIVGVLVAVLVGMVAIATPAPAASRQDELPAPVASPDEVRDTADGVLARPEFQRPEPNIVERAQAWIEERVGRVLQTLVTGDGASVIGWGVLLAALAVIIYLLSRFSRTVQLDPRRSTEISVERSRSADDWDDEAERHERDEQWKLALRCRFRALIAALVANGHVDDIPGRTAGEYRSEVEVSVPESAGQFATATTIFEDAWYGNRPTGPDENRRFRDLATDVRDASSAHRSEAPPAAALAEAVSV